WWASWNTYIIPNSYGNMGGRMPYSPCKKPHAPSRAGSAERWPSGLRRTLGKRVCGKLYRGFESHSLRHLLVLPHSPPFERCPSLGNNKRSRRSRLFAVDRPHTHI